MQTAMFAVPLVLVAMAVQLVASLLWLRPLVSTGIPIYWRGLAVKADTKIDSIENDFRSHASMLVAYCRLSEDTLGLRASLFWGFTGVQGLVSTAKGPRFQALLAWPVVPAYAFFLWFLWWHSPWGASANIGPTLIVLAVPAIDIMFLRGAIRRMEARASAA